MCKNRLLFLLVLAALGGSSAVRPQFSFDYDGKLIVGEGDVSPDGRLRVSIRSAAYPEFDAVEWFLEFENPSDRDSGILSDICDCDALVTLPAEVVPKNPGINSKPGERAVVSMNGCIHSDNYKERDDRCATEFGWVMNYFRGKRNPRYAFESHGGRSSDRQAPFFEVTQDGRGAFVAIGWTGDWRASFTNVAEGVIVKSGLKRARFRLRPGEKVRTTTTLVMGYAAGEDASNKFRRLMRGHFSPKACRGVNRESIFANMSWGSLSSESLKNRIAILKSKGFRFDDFWIDAAWYGKGPAVEAWYDGGWSKYTGDWTCNPEIHPAGLTDVASAAHDAGMGVMLWFEPEHVSKSAEFAKEHPEWLLPGPKGDYLIDLGRADVREWFVSTLSDYITRLGMSCYTQDFNTEPDKFFAIADAKESDRDGIAEIRYVTGLYAALDELLRRHPQLLIDNCASGGRRFDIEMLKRTFAFFRSDYMCGLKANPDVNQAVNVGISRVIPHNGCTTHVCDVYALRSAYTSSYAPGFWPIACYTEETVDWAAAKKCHDEYLRLRPYFLCDFYNHGSATADPAAWALWQYHDEVRGAGVVLAFRRVQSPSPVSEIRLRGLPKNAKVEVVDLDDGRTFVCDGSFRIELPQAYASAAFEYRVK